MTNSGFAINRADEFAVAGHLTCCDQDFVPPLSGRVDLASYARKIAVEATTFEHWSGPDLVGLVAAYCNDPRQIDAFITSVSVVRHWQKKGLAAELLAQCVEYLRAKCFRRISLEVNNQNAGAIRLYRAHGFVTDGGPLDGCTSVMRLEI